ncbi:MAG: MBL fold metallo-hydrolase [Chloroflexota bacterium]
MKGIQTKPEAFRIKFWGVRGSYPTPGEKTVRFGGNTPCVEVCVAGQTLILDAGTGIIPLGQELMQRSHQSEQPVSVTLLFSHMHHDHTQGFPFFTPAFILSTHMHIFGPHTFESDLEQVLAHNMVPPVFPVTLQDMSAAREIHSLNEHQILILGEPDGPRVLPANHAPPRTDEVVIVRVLRSYAHPGGVLVYRIEWQDQAVVYATDTEGYANTDRRLVDFAQQADLLIHDAQYTQEHYLGLSPGVRSTQGWGHSTASMACDVARAARVRRLALFHYDPGYSDQCVAQIEASARRRFKAAFAASEGMQIRLETPISAGYSERGVAYEQAAANRDAL